MIKTLFIVLTGTGGASIKAIKYSVLINLVHQFVSDVVKDTDKKEYLRPFVRICLDRRSQGVSSRSFKVLALRATLIRCFNKQSMAFYAAHLFLCC